MSGDFLPLTMTASHERAVAVPPIMDDRDPPVPPPKVTSPGIAVIDVIDGVVIDTEFIGDDLRKYRGVTLAVGKRAGE